MDSKSKEGEGVRSITCQPTKTTPEKTRKARTNKIIHPTKKWVLLGGVETRHPQRGEGSIMCSNEGGRMSEERPHMRAASYIANHAKNRCRFSSGPLFLFSVCWSLYFYFVSCFVLSCSCPSTTHWVALHEHKITHINAKEDRK